MERQFTMIAINVGNCMNFQIMEQVGGKEFKPVLNEGTNEPLLYPCPKEAAKAAKILSDMMGGKFQPRPVVESDDIWKAREAQRFVSGEYKPVCWSGQYWWDQNHNASHFVHVAIKDPTRIAFTKDARDGAKDVQTSMKPGKYLTEFFGKILTTEQIKVFAMQHSTTFENKELKFATTPEEIQKVYEAKNLGSCFSGTTKANLYGSGDFAVAYIETEGIVKARAVCCPERKIYARPYGDEYRLTKLLAEAGYKKSNYSHEWTGLKLLTKWFWRGFYTDFGGDPKPNADEKDKEFFTI